MTTASAQDYRTLLKAPLFAIGPIGVAGRISPAELALIRILQTLSATAILLDLLSNATVPGQLYALLGLLELGDARIEELIETYRERTDEVAVQTGCYGFSQPVCSVVALISDGTYLNELRLNSEPYS